MESDRGAVLTLRAAARGVVDFSAARVRDVAWWRRVNALVTAMADEDALTGLRVALDVQRSLVGNAGLTKDSFEKCQKTMQALFGDILDALYPWAAKGSDAKRAGVVGGLIDAYKKLVGDPDDPVFREKLIKDMERQDEMAGLEAPPETDDDRIDRMLRERQVHYDRIYGRTTP